MKKTLQNFRSILSI